MAMNLKIIEVSVDIIFWRERERERRGAQFQIN
jgi:hypothetical protein